jgi:hypothetical protein
MGNVFTFFDQFFKTLHPNIYDLDNEDQDDNNVESELIRFIDDCNCKACYYRKNLRESLFGIVDKTD